MLIGRGNSGFTPERLTLGTSTHYLGLVCRHNGLVFRLGRVFSAQEKGKEEKPRRDKGIVK